ncbi:hypothetical protein ACHQM5_012769 [Ranunculus cassubicifolius]
MNLLLRRYVPSYNDLLPLLYSHELRNKSLLPEHLNSSVAFVGQRSNPRCQNKRGYNSGFSSKGRGFAQSNARPSYNQRNGNAQSNRSPANAPRPAARTGFNIGATAHITYDAGQSDTQVDGIRE